MVSDSLDLVRSAGQAAGSGYSLAVQERLVTALCGIWGRAGVHLRSLSHLSSPFHQEN